MIGSSEQYYVDPATYDAVTASIVADIAPHVELVRSAQGPVIEVCCGNGRLLVPVLEAGLACDGLDYDARMLDDLRAKLAARKLTATLHHADMRDFTLPHRYGLIVIPFNSFLHNLTQADQLATLRACRQNLENDGRLAIVAFHPSAEKLLQYASGEHLVFDHPWGGGTVRTYDRAHDDRIEQVRRVHRRIEFLDGAGALREERRYEFALRYVFKPEMELLLHVAGFARWDVRPAFADYRDAASAAGGRAPQEGDILLWQAWRS